MRPQIPSRSELQAHANKGKKGNAFGIIEGHLKEPYEVFTRDNQPGKRRELLERLFGPRMRMGPKN